MAFFEDVGKKITWASQSTLQKTKDVADVVKLNSQIAEEEKLIQTNYTQIGKLYVSFYREEPEESFAELIKAIVESEKKIAAYTRQIQDIKGVQRCEKCGAEIVRGTAFCSSCGAPMSVVLSVENDEMVQCKNCGVMVRKGMRFCSSCGQSMESEHTLNSDTGMGNIIQKKVCPSCGAEIDEDSMFCSECGVKITNL